VWRGKGIGSGVGFRVDGKQLNLAVMQNKGFLATSRQRWHDFFRTADGLIFVVDNTRDEAALREARKLLFQTLVLASATDEELDEERGDPQAVTSAPLLVMVCEMEKNADRCWTPAEVAEGLGLSKFMQKRRWCVRSVAVENMSGIAESLHWLLRCMS